MPVTIFGRPSAEGFDLDALGFGDLEHGLGIVDDFLAQSVFEFIGEGVAGCRHTAGLAFSRLPILGGSIVRNFSVHQLAVDL